MSAGAPCDRCVAPPVALPVPFHIAQTGLPASIAWLPPDEPAAMREFFEHLQSARATADPKSSGLSFVEVLGAKGQVRTLLSTVLLSLAVQRHIEFFDVTHRAGWGDRLFGKSATTEMYIGPAGASGGDGGALERSILDAIRQSRDPHGTSTAKLIRRLCGSVQNNPGGVILKQSKEDAIARGLAQWATVPEPPQGSGFLGSMLTKAVSAATLYEVLPAARASVAADRGAFEELRRAVEGQNAALLPRLEREIESGLQAMTAVD
jgi:hypothetical protein